MFNVCPHCGMYSVEKRIDPSGPFAVCPNCGHPHPFLMQPLFIITGASGAGKTATGLGLVKALPECVVLETDILWDQAFNTPQDNYRKYRDMWLRLAKNIGQSGRPVVLIGSATPEQFEHLPERRYFSMIYYLALVCEDNVLAERLRERPAWRETSSPDFIRRMLEFNTWFKANAYEQEPAMTLFDTSNRTIEESVSFTAEWVRNRLP